MALFKSNYPELSFYVENERKQFSKGEYRTEGKKEIEVLDGMLDATRVDEPKPEAKAVAKPTPKRTTPATKK